MPVTTTRQSPSPVDLIDSDLNHQKLASPLGLHPRHGYARHTSMSTISSATSTFSSILDEPPHYTASVLKAPFNDVGAWTLYDFECHVHCCAACQDLYHYHLTTSELCHTGHALAQKVVNLAYGKTAAARVCDTSSTMRFTIPAGHVYVKDLLVAVDDKVRRRRMLAEARMYRQGYSSFDRTYDVKGRAIALPRASTATTDNSNNHSVDDDAYNQQQRLPSLEVERPKTRGKPLAEVEPSPAEKTLRTLRWRAFNTKYSVSAESTQSVSPPSTFPASAPRSQTPTASILQDLHPNQSHHATALSNQSLSRKSSTAHSTTVTADLFATSRSRREEEKAKTAPMPPSTKTFEAEAKKSASRSRNRSKDGSPAPSPKRAIRWSWFLT